MDVGYVCGVKQAGGVMTTIDGRDRFDSGAVAWALGYRGWD